MATKAKRRGRTARQQAVLSAFGRLSTAIRDRPHPLDSTGAEKIVLVAAECRAKIEEYREIVGRGERGSVARQVDNEHRDILRQLEVLA